MENRFKTIPIFTLLVLRTPKYITARSFEDEESAALFGRAKRPLRVHISKGRIWGDFLNADTVAPPIISAVLADKLKAQQFKGYKLREVEFQLAKGVPPPPCSYFAFIPTGRKLDCEHRAFTRGETREEITPISYAGDKPPAFYAPGKLTMIQFIPKYSSWDGSDFMKWNDYPGYGPNCIIACTRRVVKFLFDHAVKNISAKAFDSISNKGVKLLSSASWPPEDWYSDLQPVDDSWKNDWPIARDE